jgi:hypothetical protein
VADTSSISQAIVEAAADDATTSVSQAVVEAGVGDATTSVSQAVLEAAAADATVSVSQVIIEFSLGEEIPPSPPEPITGTFAFDEGGGVEWWIACQPSDSGVETRDKVIRSLVVTGLITNADAKIYVWGPTDPVVVSDIEDGINSTTGAVLLPDTTNVTRSPRMQVNCSNAMIHLIRVAGTWDGTGPRNRVDEMQYEVSVLGVRR